MAFFARPNLDDIQFKQLDGSVLTLSGQTQIVTTSGLTLADGSGNTIVINAKGAAIGNVLTFDGNEISLGSPSSGASTGIYTCASPTTCTVGGLSACTNISGCSIGYILEQILVPTLCPTFTNPSISSFALYYAGTSTSLPSLFEVGHSVDIDGCVSFNRGCINPQYTAVSDKRSGVVGCYDYLAFGTPYECKTVGLSNCYPFGTNIINVGSNWAYATVCYSGGTQPYDSAGNSYCSPLPTSATTKCSNGLCACIVVTGIYPWYWGKITCAAASGFGRPDAECIKHEITGNTCGGLNTGNKVVGPSNSTIGLNFNSGDNDYLWFATPTGSTTKTCWFIDALNKGNIGGAPTVYPAVGTNLFPMPEIISGVTSVGTGSWVNESYKVYISNYQSCSTSGIELRNS